MLAATLIAAFAVIHDGKNTWRTSNHCVFTQDPWEHPTLSHPADDSCLLAIPYISNQLNSPATLQVKTSAQSPTDGSCGYLPRLGPWKLHRAQQRTQRASPSPRDSGQLWLLERGVNTFSGVAHASVKWPSSMLMHATPIQLSESQK